MPAPFRAFWLRPHLLAAIGVAVCVALLAPSPHPEMRPLAGWCAGVAAYVGLTVHGATGRSRAAMRARAALLDDSASTISVFALLAAAASFGSVVVLIAAGRTAGPDRAYALALAGASMVCTWVFVQVVFTVHYAHVFYGGEDGGGEDGTERGGLDFHGEAEPDFWDFLYFSVTIGAAAATSDTDVLSRRMRRIVTAHTAAAYLFNTGVLALAVNMAAGFVPH